MQKTTKGILAVYTVLVMVVCLIGNALPINASTSTYIETEGAYTVTCNLVERVVDGTTGIVRVQNGTLTITTQTLGVISSASLTLTNSGINAGVVALTGTVGVGTSPKISLVGSANGINVILNGQVQSSDDVATRITGKIDGFLIASGAASMASDESGTSAPSQVAQETGIESILLTQSSGAGSTYVQWTPQPGIRLKDLTRVSETTYGLWEKLELNKSGGAQLELRFTSKDNVDPNGAGHVDVTLLAPKVGDGNWTHVTYSQTSTAQYYGNDPIDGTAFDGGGNVALSTVVAAIDDEAAMGDDSAQNWRLTRVRVELWDAGARTDYIDDVMINGRVNGFEPAQLSGSFWAEPSA